MASDFTYMMENMVCFLQVFWIGTYFLHHEIFLKENLQAQIVSL
jgi:hypothetical protein